MGTNSHLFFHIPRLKILDLITKCPILTRKDAIHAGGKKLRYEQVKSFREPLLCLSLQNTCVFKLFFSKLGDFSSPSSNGSSEIAIGFFSRWDTDCNSAPLKQTSSFLCPRLSTSLQWCQCLSAISN